jgi:hypothetical protein
MAGALPQVITTGDASVATDMCVGAHRKEFSTALTQNISLKLRTDGVHSAFLKLNFSGGNESSLNYSYWI